MATELEQFNSGQIDTFNTDYASSKFDTQMDIASQVTGGITATVVDAGASIWNSTVGLVTGDTVETRDLLAKINKDASVMYDEHPDLIGVASFIGGSLIPSTLALKGMNLLRAGAKGASWFSEAGKVENLAKVTAGMEAGIQGTTKVNQAVSSIYRAGLANQTLDAAAMEVAVLSTMNAHPMLEDYWDDPIKNFGISLAFGGVIGGGIGHIADRALVSSTKGAVEEATTNVVIKDLATAPEMMPDIGKLQVLGQNIKTLENLVDPKYAANAAVKELANNKLLEQRATQTSMLEGLSDKFKNLSSDDKQILIQDIVSNPGMSTVNALKYFEAPLDDKFAKSTTVQKGLLKEENTSTKVVDTKTGEVVELTDSIYHPELKAWTTPEEASAITRYVSSGGSVNDLIKTVDTRIGTNVRDDASLNIAFGSTSSVDKDFLSSLVRIDKMALKELKVVEVDDLPVMDAIIARAFKNPAEFDGVTIKVAHGAPDYNALAKATFAQNSVKASHIDDIQKIATKESEFNLSRTGSSLSTRARSSLLSWIDGSRESKDFLRRGAEGYFRRGIVSDTQQAAAGFVKEMAESAESVKLREFLKKNIADKDGNVYLYRGQAAGRKGHSALESYTASHTVSKGFAGANGNSDAKLYRVNVDDIVGYIHGMSGPNAGKGEMEFLVGSPKHPIVDALPTGTGTYNKSSFAIREVSPNELREIAISKKEELINSMLRNDKPLEYIAIRTNTPLETIQAYSTVEYSKASLSELEKEGFGLFHYNSAEKIEEYLDPKLRALRASHSVNKLKFSELLSALDNRSINNINKEVIRGFLAQSPSAVMKEFDRQFFGNELEPQGLFPILDQLRAGVAENVNNKLGNPFISSADFFLRNTANGRIVTHIGKTLQEVASRAGTALVKPLAERMAIIAKDEVKVIETMTFLNVNASLKGWRDVINGQLVQKVERLVDGKLKEVIEPVQYLGKDYKVIDKDVLALIDELKKAGREAYEMGTTVNRISGRASLNDLGFWTPSIDFRNKHLAYIWDKANNRTQVLWGRNINELKENIATYMSVKGLKAGEELVTEDSKVAGRVVTKQEQELHNILSGRNDPLTMEIANIEKYHTGSAASAIVSTNTDRFNELIGAYENLVERNVKKTAHYLMSDTIDMLDTISHNNRRFSENQPLDRMAAFLNKEEDGAAKVRNILLGSGNLGEYQPWKLYNENFETTVNWGVETIKDVMKTVTSPLGGFLGKRSNLTPEVLAKQDYEQISKRLEERGIVNPFKEFDDGAAKAYGVARLQDSKNVAKRAIYAGNAFAATMALRVLDLASPLVNAMSVPILTTLAKAQNLPPTLMGAVKKNGGTPPVAAILYEGARLSNSERGKVLADAWEKAGHFTSFVTESNKALRLTRSVEPGLLTKGEKIIDSKIVDWLSLPADKTEDYIRRQMMFTGYSLAKKMYPDLGDTGATIFARDFMDRSLGNYHSGQRPVFFQGTMGVALGLFQTYMLTLAQNTYRALELKDYKAIGKAMLAQNTIFGASSLPGFDMVSQAIGDHFSDENIDLTTGTFRAVGDRMGKAILYGLPSSLGPALYTRGDISPRIPSPIGDPMKIAAVNMISQSVDFGANLAAAVDKNGGNVGMAMAQALSLQSVSRPLARVSELVTGHSVSKYGDVYASPEEVYTPVGVVSRVLGARPIEEAKAREALMLDRTYGRIDRDARIKVTNELKLAVRNGNLTSEKMESLADEFMKKSGSAEAWRQAVNKAISANNMSGKEQVISKLKPDSPLMYMMDSLDGEVVE